MLCVMVDITALYQRMLKNKKLSKESCHFQCQGQQFVYQAVHLQIEKFKATIQVKEVPNLN